MIRVLVLVLALAAIVHAEPYARDVRGAHLGKALEVLRVLGDDERRAFELELHTGVRTRCKPSARPATTACMIEIARELCAKRSDPAGCAAAADIILTNQHAESDLVDQVTRMRLVRGSSDYHAAVLAELWSRYTLLAAELALSPPDPDLATRIDRFCTARDRIAQVCEPGAKTCVGSIAWQRCAAGLVWYVAAEARR